MERYGGNTSCVEVRGGDGTLLVLDAGTGIRRFGETLGSEPRRVDLLLTHLHMDHIQGLGFFDPLLKRGMEIHIWGPSSTTLDLRSRLGRYLSPPLFPVRLRDLPCDLTLHDVVSLGNFRIGGLGIRAMLVCHPGPTVGYRITENGTSVTYLSDHEPALGATDFPGDPEWISGFDLAEGADLLIHDSQYTAEEYPEHVGWGHSSLPQTLAFATVTGVRELVPFHHDPSHSDEMLDRVFAEARQRRDLPIELTPGMEGSTFFLEE
jgi:phosphoribosyl 1,2-cyclic phosphodiesterase